MFNLFFSFWNRNSQSCVYAGTSSLFMGMCFILGIIYDWYFVKTEKLFDKATFPPLHFSFPPATVWVPLSPRPPLMFRALFMLPLTLTVMFCIHSYSPTPPSELPKGHSGSSISIHTHSLLYSWFPVNPNSIKWELVKQPRTEEFWRRLRVPRKPIWSDSRAVHYNIAAWMQGSCSHLL